MDERQRQAYEQRLQGHNLIAQGHEMLCRAVQDSLPQVMVGEAQRSIAAGHRLLAGSYEILLRPAPPTAPPGAE